MLGRAESRVDWQCSCCAPAAAKPETQIASVHMKRNYSRQRAFLIRIVLLASFAMALVVVHRVRAGNEPVHLATDWSHRHMIFSAPQTLMDRFRFSTEPRYVQQWLRRNSERADEERGRERWRWRHAEENPMHGDWSVFLGNSSNGLAVGTVGAAQYPAKYAFDTTVANCATATQPDFVVWNTSLAGSTGSIPAVDIGSFITSSTASNSTITITNGANILTMTASTRNLNTGPGAGTFVRGGSPATRASNLAVAINLTGNGSFVGVSATASGNTVTFVASIPGSSGNGITVAAQAASGFAWAAASFEDGQATGVPSVVAYDNLYTNCSGAVPSAYWAYNTGGTVSTSVALSFDGKQVAFVQTVGGVANLVMLKWAASSGTPTTPIALSSQASASAYRACTAPCMYAIAFSGGTNDTNSSPYYDFGSDTVYVGDTPAAPGSSNASLHKFTGVFVGIPAEVTAGGWPATLGVEAATSPVYDANNGQVYVADANNGSGTSPDGGFAYRVDHTAGTVVKSARLSTGVGFADAPIVDSTNGTVYLFTSAGGACPGTTSNFVYQLAGNFASSDTFVTSAAVSPSATCSTATPLYDGDFDNAYYTTGTGNMYVCGNIGGNPTLYQVSVGAGALGTVTVGPNVAAAATTCSPVTEFYNANAAGGAKDWIYLSVIASGKTTTPIGCPLPAGGCLMSFDVTSVGPISTSTATIARIRASGGASGVIADNDISATGDSELYFTPLAAEGCTTATNPGIGGCSKQVAQSNLN